MKTDEYDLTAVRDLSDRLQWTADKREASLARAWNKVNAITVARDEVGGGGGLGASSAPKRRRLIPVAVGPVAASLLALALVVGVVAYLAGAGAERSLPPSAAPPVVVADVPIEQAWADLAAASADAAPLPAPPGSFVYVRSVAAAYSMSGDEPRRLVNEDRETWSHSNGLVTVLVLQHGERLIDNDPEGDPGNNRTLMNPSAEWLAALPTDPEALFAQLAVGFSEDTSKWSVRQQVWSVLMGDFANGLDVLLPTAQRRALYQMLARDDALTAQRLTFGDRALIAITRTETETTSGTTDVSQLLFDAGTGRVVGRRTPVSPPGPQNLASWAIWTVVGVVPAVGDRP